MDRFETFVASINTIYRLIQKIKDSEMREFGLRGAHVMCLYMLHRHREGLTLMQLSALCGEDKAATSRGVSELVERGYLRHVLPEGGSRYRARIFLTEEGEAVAARIGTIVTRVVDEAGSGLTEAQRAALYDALAQIAEKLQGIYGQSEGDPPPASKTIGENA